MTSHVRFASPTASSPRGHRDHSPSKPSPLRHSLSTRSNNSDAEQPPALGRLSTINAASPSYAHGDDSLYSVPPANDPFVSSPPGRTESHKRNRSESPVKKSAAFAKWEQREQADQDQQLSRQPSVLSQDRRSGMYVSPKKLRDDNWRANVGRSETRAALQPVAGNTIHETAPERSRLSADAKFIGHKENDEYQRYRPPEDNFALSPRTPMHTRAKSEDPGLPPVSPEPKLSLSPTARATRNSMATLSRSDSMRGSTRPRQPGHVRFSSTENATAQLDDDDLVSLQKSSTPQFQHLSKMAGEPGTEDFGIHSPEEQVVGMTGRKKLQRSGSVRPSGNKESTFASQYSSTRWMETQRKHLQAYEYLCHIGEARAWLEDVLEPVELPPIVQLEESLRDGVTLAEVVVRLAPSLQTEQQQNLGSQRIFRSSKLQFRHSDNIALFFRFLAQAELPELFRFELVDLYEKKNIPKVIYCIHALSWLLFRNGIVHFRIGNLVGQLHFEEHELEATQKGIDRSGVQMPNFGGMREAMQVEEPEPEPTPDELLADQLDVIVDLQSQIRGALVRMELGDVMQRLWDAEPQITQLQAVARGGFARELFDFRYYMDLSTRRFQAAAAAFLVRQRSRQREHNWKHNERAIVLLQSIWRGKVDRAQTRNMKTQLQYNQTGVKELQAAIRGALGRWRAGDLWHESRDAEKEVEGFQALARAALTRMRVSNTMSKAWDSEASVRGLQALIRGAQSRNQVSTRRKGMQAVAIDITRLQAAARGLIQRKEKKQKSSHFEMHNQGIMHTQAAARGLLLRLRQAKVTESLHRQETDFSKLQAIARGHIQRARHGQLRQQLSQHVDEVSTLQTLSRAMLARRKIGEQLGALEDQESQIRALQSLARASLERRRIYNDLTAMQNEETGIQDLQAFARAMLLRNHIGETLAEVEQYETAVVELQAACRAMTVRRNFQEKRRHYNENMQKVIKLQSFVRAKQQGESYKSLVNGKNPPLPVVRRHLHLLTDSTLEFEGELEAERLRRQVVESVRRNELVEGYVEGLDVKIALLVKNKITLDEVVKHQKHFGGSASQLLRHGTALGQHSGGFNLKALNKSSRKKLTGYEELFFMLQTQPAYLARLFQHLTAKGVAEKESKSLDRLVMILFGYAQKNREEYCLTKLLTTAMQQLTRQSQSLDDFLRFQNGAFHHRLLLSYIRSPKDRSYLKTLLGGLIKNGICAQDHLDLESDPLQIYRALITNEELSTGRASSRPRDLPREVVIREPDVRPKYVEHLQELRDLCDGFFLSLEETLHKMPFGIRHLAAEQFAALREQFPRQDPAYLAMLVGNWLWKTYLLPALKEPEMWGIVDRGLSPLHRRNLGQVITVLGQVALGRLFAAENLYLQPLNNWVTESLGRWQDTLQHLFEVPSSAEHFDADQYSDLYAKNKPTLYIKLADIFSLHSLVSEQIAVIAPARDDPIKEILADLGTPKSNESDLSSAAQGGDITLTLKSRFNIQEDPNSEVRALFTATKRYVLYIIKVQSGSNLMEILLRPITHEDADRWIQVVAAEMAEKERHDQQQNRRQNPHFDPWASLRGARTQSVYSEAPSTFSEDKRDLLDLQSMTYAELKSSALEHILALEAPSVPPQFRVSRQNNYQEVLNALAADIRQKHRRRLERQHELESIKATLAQLDTKAEFFEEQLKSYNDYIEQSLHTLANKKGGGRTRFLMPFSKQWTHERELNRLGRQPRFGSYKYSARQLADKGVLVSWPAFAPDHWGQLNFVVASDEPGTFHLEASSGALMVPGGSVNLLLDDLLQAQYDGKQTITVFEESSSAGGAKLGVDLLLHLVFKKFYRDE